jgi:3-phosphoshikimate 1-carboxyvinyltransferase
MKIKINKGKCVGEIKAPPSKSYAHRLLIASALANGKGKIDGIIDSDDMLATLNCISALGLKYEKKGEEVSFFGGEFVCSHRSFNANESGSTLRFFIPIALATGNTATFYGTERLIARGIDIYEEIFLKQGIECTKEKTSIKLNGKLKPDTFYVRGDISSQFISGLIFALPLLSSDSKIVITTKLESESYVDITIDVVKKFGIEILRQGNEILIKGNQKYTPQNLSVEGDASNGAFLDAFNALGGDVSVLGLNKDTLQPDYIYKKYFEKIVNGTPALDLSACPDLGPICFALAAVRGGAKFTGTKRLKIKESDRADAMAKELSKLGGKVDLFEDEAIIYPIKKLNQNITLSCHNDHRIAMALACILTLCGGTLDGCECVKKSYPHFFEDIRKINAWWEEV